MALRGNQTTGCDKAGQCAIATIVPSSGAYAVTREQLKAIADVREMAKRAALRAGTNGTLLDFALDVANRLRGL